MIIGFNLTNCNGNTKRLQMTPTEIVESVDREDGLGMMLDDPIDLVVINSVPQDTPNYSSVNDIYIFSKGFLERLKG